MKTSSLLALFLCAALSASHFASAQPVLQFVPANECQINQACGTCIANPNCFWCRSGNICSPKEQPFIQACADPRFYCQCSQFGGSCTACTQQEGCVWCHTTGQCRYFLDTATCLDVRNFPANCPAPAPSDASCLQIPSCNTCTTSGCHWCQSQGLCRSQQTAAMTCPAASRFTTPGQCF